MQINNTTANKLSALCQRVSRAEKSLGVTSSLPSRPSNAVPQNPFEKLNVLCQRIKRLEKKVGIKRVPNKPGFKPLGPSGNAVLANKVNTLCSRLARVEKKL